MSLCMNFNMVFVLAIGARIIVTSGGKTLDVGQITAMLSYGFQILFSLMMLSMIYVMLTMSAEAFRRITEVMEEIPCIEDPKEPVYEVKDGSVDKSYGIHVARLAGMPEELLKRADEILKHYESNKVCYKQI